MNEFFTWTDLKINELEKFYNTFTFYDLRFTFFATLKEGYFEPPKKCKFGHFIKSQKLSKSQDDFLLNSKAR